MLERGQFEIRNFHFKTTIQGMIVFADAIGNVDEGALVEDQF